jgi:hypothetical protein
LLTTKSIIDGLYRLYYEHYGVQFQLHRELRDLCIRGDRNITSVCSCGRIIRLAAFAVTVARNIAVVEGAFVTTAQSTITAGLAVKNR